MLFNLSPLFALIPLILYIVLAFRDINPLANVGICVLLSAILTKHNLLQLGSTIADSLGSFISMIGFIIMLGSALGAVLKRTGVAENIINAIMKKIGVKSEKKAIIASMLSSIILVALLGTMAGANAMLAPILIPLVAQIGITPSTLAAIFQGAGQTGLFIGPYSPQVVTIMGLTKISYGQYLLAVGLPISLICWLITYFMCLRIQKRTKGVYSYDITEKVSEAYKPTKDAKNGTWAFCISIVLLIAYGIYSKSGSAYAILVLAAVSVITGLVSHLKLNDLIDTMMEGAGRMVSMYVMFVLFTPFITFIEEAGAFTALSDLVKPLIASGSKVIFTLVTSFVGLFGISGAATAQSIIIDKMFKSAAQGLGLSSTLWALIILVGSQIDSFAYPEADMLGQMGIARSKDLKNMVKLGITITVATIGFTVIMAIFG